MTRRHVLEYLVMEECGFIIARLRLNDTSKNALVAASLKDEIVSSAGPLAPLALGQLITTAGARIWPHPGEPLDEVPSRVVHRLANLLR